MPNLSETLGSLLKDIAHSRVKSDIFSRQASLEYIKDPVLRLFPVPRAEIRSADLELTFAVAETRQEDVDEAAIARSVLLENLPALRQGLLSVPVKPSRTSKQFEALSDLLKGGRPQFETDMDKRLEAFFRDKATRLSTQIKSAPASFGRTVGSASSRIIRENINVNKIEVSLGSQFRKEVGERVSEWSKLVSSAIETAVERARSDSFTLDLAVTKDELANVPQSAIARVKLSVEIQNYEWIQLEDENGRTINKLVVR